MRIRLGLGSMLCVAAVWMADAGTSATGTAQSTWQTERVAVANAGYASLAFHGGLPALAYSHVAQRHALLFSLGPSPWSQETVTSGTASLGYPRMVTGNGTLFICFAQNGLKVASRTANGWTIELIDKAGGECGSLALDATGSPAVAYSTGKFRDLKLARRTGSTWTISTAKAKAGVDNSHLALAFDPAGVPHIAYTVQPTVYLVQPDGASWRTSVVASGQTLFGNVDLKFGAGGEAWLAFTGDTNATSSTSFESKPLFAARRASATSSWEFQLVEPEVSVGVSLALDPAGLPAIAHLAPGSVELRFTRLDGVAWAGGSVVLPQRRASRPSLAFDGDTPVIGWVDVLGSGTAYVNLSRQSVTP